MSVTNPTLEQLQPYVDKEAIIHLKQEDGQLTEITATIKVATVAGVGYKEKGKSGIELLANADPIEEIDYAPVKQKSVSQKKLQPIEFGQARQHLVDRHGVTLSWAKDADEKAALEYHNGLDHSDLGHRHEAKDEKPADEREQAIAEAGQSS